MKTNNIYNICAVVARYDHIYFDKNTNLINCIIEANDMQRDLIKNNIKCVNIYITKNNKKYLKYIHTDYIKLNTITNF